MIFLTNPGGDVARKAQPRYTSGPKKGQFKKAPKRNASPKPKAARRTKPNPHRRNTVARKAQPRHKSGPKKGQFKKNPGGGGSRRASSRRSAPARRARRNQPRAKGFVADLTDGAIGAAQVLTGKAVVRIGADMLPANLRAGQMIGPAVQVALAILLSNIATNFVSKKTAHMLLVGGFVAPVEELIVSANVPFLSPALSAYPQLRAYPQEMLTGGLGLNAYPAGSESVDVQGYDNGYAF